MKNQNYRASHHRVNAELHLAASKKAQFEGFSMSTLATYGVEDYVSQISEKQKSKAALRVIEGFNKNRASELPEAVVAHINQMRQNKDKNLTAYLKALHDAGWSYASLSKHIGITRQGLHLQISKAIPVDDKSALPMIVVGPGHTSFPAHSSTNEKRKDWSIWIENNLYALAVERARTDLTPMFQVMEGILLKYVQGEIILPNELKASRSRNHATTLLTPSSSKVEVSE